jgi:hypothetical protein
LTRAEQKWFYRWLMSIQVVPLLWLSSVLPEYVIVSPDVFFPTFSDSAHLVSLIPRGLDSNSSFLWQFKLFFQWHALLSHSMYQSS